MRTQDTKLSSAAGTRRTDRSQSQRVLIINGNSDMLEMLEPVLDGGNYDVVFVESTAHGYSQVRQVKPDLVILCLDMEDAEGLRVLSMLKLDPVTRDIPILTCTAPPSLDEDENDDAVSEDEEPFFVQRPAPRMN
jgi:CheY-like chemotaxis protein